MFFYHRNCAIADFQTNHDKPNESGVNHWNDLMGFHGIWAPKRLCVWDYVDPSKNKRYIAINPTGIR